MKIFRTKMIVRLLEQDALWSSKSFCTKSLNYVTLKTNVYIQYICAKNLNTQRNSVFFRKAGSIIIPGYWRTPNLFHLRENVQPPTFSVLENAKVVWMLSNYQHKKFRHFVGRSSKSSYYDITCRLYWSCTHFFSRKIQARSLTAPMRTIVSRTILVV